MGVIEYFSTQQWQASSTMFAPFLSLVILLVNLNIPTFAGSFLPPFIPPLPRPETAGRPDNSLVPPPVRGAYDYQGGHMQRYSSRGWAARYIDQVWGEQTV